MCEQCDKVPYIFFCNFNFYFLASTKGTKDNVIYMSARRLIWITHWLYCANKIIFNIYFNFNNHIRFNNRRSFSILIWLFLFFSSHLLIISLLPSPPFLCLQLLPFLLSLPFYWSPISLTSLNSLSSLLEAHISVKTR
jgi:hypothetical protein